VAKTTTLTAAFAHFGTYPLNPRWAWSAVSPDEKTVAVTIWEDEVGPDGAVNFFDHPTLETWRYRPGNKDRIRNLKVARDKCGGLFHVVMVKAADPKAEPRQIANRYPADFMMRLVDLDEETGEFSAVRFDRGA